MSEVTAMMDRLQQGDGRAADELLPLVYEELRRLAAARLSQEASDHTLQPTALVHEAWLRLVGQGDPERRPEWNGRAHFFGAAVEAMRRILVESARKKARIRHGGAQQRVDFEQASFASKDPDEMVLALNDALEHLALESPLKAEVVKLRYFAGMEHAETARALGIAEITVRRHWKYARAWLYMELNPNGIGSAGTGGNRGRSPG